MNARTLGISAITIVLLTSGMPQSFALDSEQSNNDSQNQSQVQSQHQDEIGAQTQNQDEGELQSSESQSQHQEQEKEQDQNDDDDNHDGDCRSGNTDSDQNGDLHSDNHHGHGEDGREQDDDDNCASHPSPLVLSPVALPNGTVGMAYSQTFTVSGDNGPFLWNVSGTIPMGLLLNVSVTGATTTISGTPTASGTFAFVVTAANGTSSVSRAYAVTINVHGSSCTNDQDDCNQGGGGIPSATTSTIKVIVNVVNSGHGVKTPPDFLTHVTGANPSLTSFQGSATGTVVTLGNGSYAIKEATSSLVGYTAAYSGDCSGTLTGGQSKTCTITNTNPAPPVLDCSVSGLYGTYFNLPKTLTGMEGPITGHVTGTTPFQFPWFGFQYLSFERNDAASVFNQTANFFPVYDGLDGDPFYTAIHWTGSIHVASSGDFAATYGSDDDLWVYVNHQLAIDNGGIQPFSSHTKQLHLGLGTSSIDLYFAERHVVQSGIEFTIAGATFSPCTATSTPSVAPTSTLEITPDVLPHGIIGTSYNQILTASGTASGPFTWSIASGTLPSGLTLDASSTNATTSISGTPNATGTYQFAIKVTNGTISATQAYIVTIAAATSTCTSNCGGNGGGGGGNINPLVLSPTTLPNGTVGTAYEQSLTVSGGNGPFTWSVASGTVPSGLALNTSSTAATTTISGTPNATGTYQFAIKVTNGATSTSAAYTVTIAAATSTCTSNCGGGGGNSNNADIAITKTVDNANPAGGGTVNYTITVTALGPTTSSIVVAHDILPGGLSLNSATTSIGVYNMSTGDWAIGMLSPNATATLHIAATVDSRSAGQTITNTASVSELSSLVDPNPSNNSSSASLLVQSAGCTSNCGGSGCTSNCGGGGGGGGGGGINVYPIVINVPSYASTTVGTTLTVPVTVTDQNGFQPVITSTSTGSATFTTSTMNIVWTPGTTGTTTITLTARDPWTQTTKIVTLEAFPSGNSNGGGGGSNSGGGSSNGGGGNILGASTSTIGKILGESTACGFYITHYIHLGRQNDFADVVRLQAFLNKWMKADLSITGFYGPMTAAVVDQFQIKYGTEVLAPWVSHGLLSDHTPTSYVYKTTRRWINMLECPALGLPVPPLP